MNPATLILGIVLLAVVATPSIAKLLEERRKKATRDRCYALERELALRSAQGTDPAALTELQVQLRLCRDELVAQGDQFDAGQARVGDCLALNSKIAAEWNHYRSTVDTDAVKRNNTRGTILRTGDEMVACFRQAVSDASSDEGLASIQRQLATALLDSKARVDCFRNSDSGCGRFGLNEPHPADMANDEESRIYQPLLSISRELESKQAARVQDVIDEAAGGTLTGTPSQQLEQVNDAIDALRTARTASVSQAVAEAKKLRESIERRTTEYVRVDYSDPNRRNNIRGEINRECTRLSAQLAEAANGIRSTADLSAVRAELALAVTQTSRRRRAHSIPANGYGKIGDEANILLPGISLIEPSKEDKTREDDACLNAQKASERVVFAKRDQIARQTLALVKKRLELQRAAA